MPFFLLGAINSFVDGLALIQAGRGIGEGRWKGRWKWGGRWAATKRCFLFSMFQSVGFVGLTMTSIIR